MELVLKNVDRKGFLAGVDGKKSEEREEEDSAACNLTIYNPDSSSKEVADKIVLQKLEELKETKRQEEESKAIERKKFNNALTFTDIPATIKKAGFHPNGSPKVAVAGLFDNHVSLVRDGKKVVYSSGLRVEFANVKIDQRERACFLIALTLSMVSFFIPLFTLSLLHRDFGIPSGILISTIFAELIPMFLIAIYTNTREGFEKIYLAPGNWIKIRLDISTTVPQVPESVLTEISGHGPFAILFEVTEGWKKIEQDPVILRVITIGDKQFFEPLVGYDMTPLEKSSLVPA